MLKYGALPVQFDQKQQTVESVSPSLGKDQLRAGIAAGLIGIGLVALYMIFFYRLLGSGGVARPRPHRDDLLRARHLSRPHAEPHAHAGRCHRHHRLRRCHRRLLCRVFRTTQRRGADRADDPVVARHRLPPRVPHDRRRRPRVAHRRDACCTCSPSGRCAASRTSSASRPRSTSCSRTSSCTRWCGCSRAGRRLVRMKGIGIASGLDVARRRTCERRDVGRSPQEDRRHPRCRSPPPAVRLLPRDARTSSSSSTRAAT